MNRSLLLFALSSIAAIACRADVRWSTQVLHLSLQAGTTEIATSFAFRNSGPEAVTLTSLHTDCGCTEAVTEKSQYAPGEAGRVDVLFHPGERLGAHEKTIEVRASDGSVTRLKLKIQITDPVLVSSRTLNWHVGQPPDEQCVQLEANGAQEIAEIGFDPPVPDGLRVRIVTIAAGHRYDLQVLPRDVSTPFETSISCRVRFVDGTERLVALNTAAR